MIIKIIEKKKLITGRKPPEVTDIHIILENLRPYRTDFSLRTFYQCLKYIRFSQIYSFEHISITHHCTINTSSKLQILYTDYTLI